MTTVSAPTQSDWRELVAADPDGLVAQSPEWMSALCAGGAYEDASRLYETPQGNRLLLPLARRRRLWPPSLALRYSFPNAWGMGGLLARRTPEPAELAAVAADLAADPALRIHIRPNPLHADRWARAMTGRRAIAIPRRAHVLDLAGGPDAAWKRLNKSARAGVRKAERSGLEIECDRTGRLVPVFYDLFELSVERWAAKQHEPLALARWRARHRDPRAKFQRIATALGDSLGVWVAWKDGEPAAASLVLRGANASETRGAMNRELAGPTSANDLLQWLAIEDASRAGCHTYHLGESGNSRSLAHFKEKFGARPVDYSEYRLERLPLTRTEQLARGIVKRAIGFRDA